PNVPPVAAVPQPQTTSPNRCELVATCRPLLQLPTPWKLPVDRSTRVYSMSSAASIGIQPVTVPRQSIVTSANAPFTRSRVSTRSVSGYVGSVKNVYCARYCSGGTTFTNSGSPRQSDASGLSPAQPVMYADM